jgi:hypothetical protein
MGPPSVCIAISGNPVSRDVYMHAFTADLAYGRPQHQNLAKKLRRNASDRPTHVTLYTPNGFTCRRFIDSAQLPTVVTEVAKKALYSYCGLSGLDVINEGWS